MTQIVPTTIVETPVSSLSLTSSASISCSSDCQIDVTATQLAYPGTVVVSTITLPVVTLFVTTESGGIVVGSSLLTNEIAPDPTLTWDYSGVPLTYPTTYVAYETFSHISIEPIGTVCVSSTLTLALPSPTNYEPLIVDLSDVPNTATVAPTVVAYLNNLPTVIQQLGETIGAGACDPNATPTANTGSSTRGRTTILQTRGAVGTITSTVKADTLPTSAVAISQVLPISSAAEPSSAPPPAPLPPAPSSSSVPPPTPSSSPPQSPVVPESSLEIPSSSSSVTPIISSLTSSRSTTNAANGESSAALSSTSTFDFTGGAAIPTGQIAGLLLGAAGLGLGLF
ncbi:hypothetical protein NX059_010893 [Plenodomus lindquistii]|nr:hypothetical protein NX059_010893 [Plenodomus lindquistii]